MERIGIGMILAGLAGKWIYKYQGTEGITLHILGVMVLIEILLATGDNR